MTLDPLQAIRDLPTGALFLLDRMPGGKWRGDLHCQGRREVAQCEFVQGLLVKLAVKWTQRRTKKGKVSN